MPEKDPGTGELKEAEEALRTILPPRDDAPPGTRTRAGSRSTRANGAPALVAATTSLAMSSRVRGRRVLAITVQRCLQEAHAAPLVTRLLRRHHSRSPVLSLSRWVRLMKSSMSDTAAAA